MPCMCKFLEEARRGPWNSLELELQAGTETEFRSSGRTENALNP